MSGRLPHLGFYGRNQGKSSDGSERIPRGCHHQAVRTPSGVAGYRRYLDGNKSKRALRVGVLLSRSGNGRPAADQYLSTWSAELPYVELCTVGLDLLATISSFNPRPHQYFWVIFQRRRRCYITPAWQRMGAGA